MEQELIIEQTEDEAQTAVAEKRVGEGTRELSFKKFKDVESLQSAYSSLEAEFTKRSQRLKRLEGENRELKRQLETKDNSSTCFEGGYEDDAQKAEFFEAFPEAQNLTSELDEILKNEKSAGLGGKYARAYARLLKAKLSTLNDELSVYQGKNNEETIINHVDERIKDLIIREYLTGIKNSKPFVKLLEGGGEITLAPPKKPKSFEEAGKLAEKMLVLK